MNRRGFFLGLGLVALAGCANPAARYAELPDKPLGAYRIGAGDEVRVTVYGLDQLTNTYLVGDGGLISIPLLHPIPAAGKTVPELTAAIAGEIGERKLLVSPQVSVQINKYRPFYVLGEVQKPGEYAYEPGMSVLSAVSLAGGYTFRADTKRVGITRLADGRTIKASGAADTPIMPGDTVYVYESWF